MSLSTRRYSRLLEEQANVKASVEISKVASSTSVPMAPLHRYWSSNSLPIGFPCVLANLCQGSPTSPCKLISDAATRASSEEVPLISADFARLSGAQLYNDTLMSITSKLVLWWLLPSQFLAEFELHHAPSNNAERRTLQLLSESSRGCDPSLVEALRVAQSLSESQSHFVNGPAPPPRSFQIATMFLPTYFFTTLTSKDGVFPVELVRGKHRPQAWREILGRVWLPEVESAVLEGTQSLELEPIEPIEIEAVGDDSDVQMSSSSTRTGRAPASVRPFDAFGVKFTAVEQKSRYRHHTTHRWMKSSISSIRALLSTIECLNAMPKSFSELWKLFPRTASSKHDYRSWIHAQLQQQLSNALYHDQLVVPIHGHLHWCHCLVMHAPLAVWLVLLSDLPAVCCRWLFATAKQVNHAQCPDLAEQFVLLARSIGSLSPDAAFQPNIAVDCSKQYDDATFHSLLPNLSNRELRQEIERSPLLQLAKQFHRLSDSERSLYRSMRFHWLLSTRDIHCDELELEQPPSTPSDSSLPPLNSHLLPLSMLHRFDRSARRERP